ncbi:MAG: protein kinase, partial [Candidatus Krumholzibacteria bacterium]
MIGQTISHYKILEKLGEGGMGVVYKAEDTKLKRAVALKFLSPQAVGGQEEKKRFVREAQAAAALHHPNICTVHEIDEVEGQTFIAMAYLDGQSLKEKLEARPLKFDEAVDFAMQVADGLQEAHESGVVHRDIKSSNVMVTTKGQAILMDFGLARQAEKTMITKEGASMGTVAYMSPEQADGVEVDHRTDIWSFGVMLYEMVTGQLPFKGDYDEAVIYSIKSEDPDPMTALRTGVPMELERITSKAMAKNSAERYQNVNDMLIDLRSVARELESGTTKARLTTTARLEKEASGSFFENLFQRRIPQILALYFAASFGIFQFVEWLVRHYPISPHLGQFSFVALVSMLPTVYLLAYFHGRPGRDRWPRFEKIGIPINVLASAALLFVLFQNKDLGAATETISFKDEAGKTVERMIPKSEFRHRITIFAFENESGDSTLNWLQYGLMTLLDFDLDQVLYLDNWRWRGLFTFKQAGFEDAVGAPLTLKRKIAIDGHYRYFVTGSFTKQNDILSIRTTVYETQRGKPIAENSLAGSDIFQLADSMSVQLTRDLKIPSYYLEKTEDLPVSELLTTSIPALKSLMNGVYESAIHNEYQAAAEHYENALKEDPSFAYVHYNLYLLFTELNQRDQAENAIRAAMQYRYRLPELYQFNVKNKYYEMQGEWQNAFENAKHWVELYPNRTQGHYTLASHYQGRMNQPDMAIAEYKRILEIEPVSHWNLRSIGDLFSNKGEYDEALKYYEHYANLYPNESGSFTEIGGLYTTMGDHEQAKLYFRKAFLIEPENSWIVTALANTERHLGNFEQALQQYGNALDVAKTPQERRSVYESLSNYYRFRGQMGKAIEYWDLTVAEMQKFASPLDILMEGNIGYIERYVLAGKEDMALKIVKEFEAQAHQLGPPLNQMSFLFDLIFNFNVEDPETGAMLEEELGKFEAFIQTHNWEEWRVFLWWGRAKLDYYREEYSQAIAGFQKAAEMIPGRGEKVLLFSRIGRCYRKLKEFEEAKETLQKALKLEPFSPQAHYELA